MPKTPLILPVAAAVLLAGCTVTPNALTPAELSEIAEEQKFALDASDQEPIAGPISIHEAMARALKYNLRHRVAMMESALAAGESRLARFDMLPALTVRAGYAGRNNYSGSFSRPLISSKTAGRRGNVATTSSERENLTGDLTLSWNILDFGLSYVRAKQAADKQLIAEEKRRSAANRLIEEVRSAYWRAISADYLQGQFRSLEAQADTALARSRKQRAAGLVPPVTALTYERELLDIKKQINNLSASLLVAKAELAKLMNLRPGTRFSLVEPKRYRVHAPLSASLDEMIDIGLRNRPEVRELAYRYRINAKEAKAGLLELLPSAELYLGANVDTNDLLFNGNWIGYGAKAAWNAMRVLRYPAKKRVIEAKGEIIREEALATSMAIMTQIHVSRIRYDLLRRELSAVNGYHATQRELQRQVEAQASAGSTGEQSVIRERMNTLVARVKRDVTYADFQNALASIFWSMGVDPYDSTLSTDQSIAEMTASLKSLWANGRHPDGRDLAGKSSYKVAKVN